MTVIIQSAIESRTINGQVFISVQSLALALTLAAEREGTTPEEVATLRLLRDGLLTGRTKDVA